MHQPLLYEINARPWLRTLSEEQGWKITLANVPTAEFERWQRLGFTHIWLMGVWSIGPHSRNHALDDPHLNEIYARVLPGWQEADITGSPYAIAGYHVPDPLGGDAGLEEFRKRLHSHGLKLILDFVPNHLGLDHPWVANRPDLFVQSGGESEGAFRQKTKEGDRQLAHGRDPYFPPWTDTAQLDFRRAETHAALIELLQSVAWRCDGVRCDMAMLLLDDVFAKTWAAFPCPDANATAEFWPEAIHAVKKVHPRFLFLAEVYWDQEARLQSQGFDYTYDKVCYDLLIQRNYPQLQRHLAQSPPQFVRASAHFLENHDEPRIAFLLSFEEHRAAALLILGLPGLRLLYHGQLQGCLVHLPVQMARVPPAAVQPEISALYDQLLRVLQKTEIGRGKAQLLIPRPAWNDNPTWENFIAVQWQSEADSFDLVVVNLAPERGQCYLPLTAATLSQYHWEFKDLLGAEIHQRTGDDLEAQGLYLDLPAHGAQLFHVRPL